MSALQAYLATHVAWHCNSFDSLIVLIELLVENSRLEQQEKQTFSAILAFLVVSGSSSADLLVLMLYLWNIRQ